MALTMLDKHTMSSDRSAWTPEITAEFEREKKNPNPCVGNALVSEGGVNAGKFGRLRNSTPPFDSGKIAGVADGLTLRLTVGPLFDPNIDVKALKPSRV